MSTLYTRDGEDTYELPGRTVNTFASGLVRIDNSYVAKTSNIQEVRNVSFKVGQPIYGDDTYPAVDGLFLYPEPQEVRKEYGMTELIASYYGRTRTDVPPPVATERSIAIGSYVISINDLFFEFVVPVGEVVNFRDQDLFNTPRSEPNAIYTDSGETLVNFRKSFTGEGGVGVSVLFDSYSYINNLAGTFYIYLRKPTMLVIAQRNFGKFVELEVTYRRNTEQDGWINA
jgi:hypothetical protein